MCAKGGERGVQQAAACKLRVSSWYRLTQPNRLVACVSAACLCCFQGILESVDKGFIRKGAKGKVSECRGHRALG
jgi:hypothetical protein